MIRRTNLTILALLLTSIYAFANVYGAIRGVVHDPQHRPVQGAMVMLKAKSSDWAKTVTTDANGEFQINAVPLGDYSVTVASQGFAQTAQDVTVISGTVPVVHFQLQVATANAQDHRFGRARSCAHGLGHAHHAGGPARHRAHSRRRPHQQPGHDHRLRSRRLRHPRHASHPRRPPDHAGCWTAFPSSTLRSRRTSARSSIPKTWNMLKSIAAATARNSATAPMEFST